VIDIAAYPADSEVFYVGTRIDQVAQLGFGCQRFVDVELYRIFCVTHHFSFATLSAASSSKHSGAASGFL